ELLAAALRYRFQARSTKYISIAPILSCCAFSLYNSSGQDARTTKFKTSLRSRGSDVLILFIESRLKNFPND
ncbi:MAG: hypothetical protein PT120_07650, partial [Aphanizomenon gracile PMC649.10]|nr:hypothetical protein [Aphanizomenon gracile PMC649.10]